MRKVELGLGLDLDLVLRPNLATQCTNLETTRIGVSVPSVLVQRIEVRPSTSAQARRGWFHSNPRGYGVQKSNRLLYQSDRSPVTHEGQELKGSEEDVGFRFKLLRSWFECAVVLNQILSVPVFGPCSSSKLGIKKDDRSRRWCERNVKDGFDSSQWDCKWGCFQSIKGVNFPSQELCEKLCGC